MARPIKNGIDYFPLDVALDTKFELIEAEFGLKGFAIVVKLLQKIYGEQGYYCEWNDEVSLVFARKNNAGATDVSEIVLSALRRGIFDRNMYKRFGILTSKGIQERYLEAKRQDFSRIRQEYLLVCVPTNNVNAAKTGVNATKTRVNGAKIPQSKEKENKVKKSKEKERGRVSPTLGEIKKFCTENNIQIDCEKFFNHYESTGWKINGNAIVNWRSRVKSWAKEDEERKRGKSYSGKSELKPPNGVFNNYSQKVYTDEEIEEILKMKRG